MPIYEYECQKCGDVFEVMQKMSDPPPAKHTCGSKRVRRVMSASAFVLKGEGWYVTDYSRKDKERKEKGKKKGGDDSGSSSSSSSGGSSDSGGDKGGGSKASAA